MDRSMARRRNKDSQGKATPQKHKRSKRLIPFSRDINQVIRVAGYSVTRLNTRAQARSYWLFLKWIKMKGEKSEEWTNYWHKYRLGKGSLISAGICKSHEERQNQAEAKASQTGKCTRRQFSGKDVGSEFCSRLSLTDDLLGILQGLFIYQGFAWRIQG